MMRHIRGLKPNEENDFAINQTKAFEKQYTTLKIAIGGYWNLYYIIVACGWRDWDHEHNVCFCKGTHQRNWC